LRARYPTEIRAVAAGHLSATRCNSSFGDRLRRPASRRIDGLRRDCRRSRPQERSRPPPALTKGSTVRSPRRRAHPGHGCGAQVRSVYNHKGFRPRAGLGRSGDLDEAIGDAQERISSEMRRSALVTSIFLLKCITPMMATFISAASATSGAADYFSYPPGRAARGACTARAVSTFVDGSAFGRP
jgi:hypothetical protein